MPTAVGQRFQFPFCVGPCGTAHNMASPRRNVYMRKKIRKTEAKVSYNLISDITFHHSLYCWSRRPTLTQRGYSGTIQKVCIPGRRGHPGPFWRPITKNKLNRWFFPKSWPCDFSYFLIKINKPVFPVGSPMSHRFGAIHLRQKVTLDQLV